MRRMLLTFAVLPLAASTLLLAAPRQPRSVQHVDVYKVAGRYGGWPANHGIWRWNNEILVGFEAGYFMVNKGGHSIDYTRPAEHLLARSVDGGATWTLERTASLKLPPGAKPAGAPTATRGRPVI